MKILFCDDEESIGTVAKEIFLNSSNDFLYTNTVNQSKIALSLDVFDVVIIDLSWKSKFQNGFDIVRAIRKIAGRPKVYIASGCPEKYTRELNEYKDFIDGVFKKPEELLRLLTKLSSSK